MTDQAADDTTDEPEQAAEPFEPEAPAHLDPDAETVVFNTGDGLKTLDAVSGLVGPTYTVRPSLRAVREAGLID